MFTSTYPTTWAAKSFMCTSIGAVGIFRQNLTNIEIDVNAWLRSGAARQSEPERPL